MTQMPFLVRAACDPAPLVKVLRREMDTVSKGGIVTSAYTLDQIIAVSGQEVLVGTAPLVPLVGIGMLLTAAGVYGALVVAGLTLGLFATVGLRQIARANGGAGGMFDAHWPAFVVPGLIIAAIGAVATWIPSRRALRINPAVLLRLD